jgi:hypothetical protein
MTFSSQPARLSSSACEIGWQIASNVPGRIFSSSLSPSLSLGTLQATEATSRPWLSAMALNTRERSTRQRSDEAHAVGDAHALEPHAPGNWQISSTRVHWQ